MYRKLNAIIIPFILLITLPYLLAWTMSSQGFVFGGFLFNPIDGNSYLAKMFEGWRGEWLFTLPYTAQKGTGAPIFLFYIFLGHLSRLTSIPSIGVFHIARVIGAFFLVREWVRFCSLFFPTSRNSLQKAVGLALLGSGLGWTLILFGIITSDLWVSEGYPFLSSFSSPHFTWGMVLLLGIFTEMTLPETPGKYIRLLSWGLLMAFIMPFGLVVASLVAGLWIAVEWKFTKQLYWRSFLALVSLGGIFLAYQYWVILQDPLLNQWNTQNQTPSPALWDLLLSFSPALLFAGWAAFSWLRNHETGPSQRLVLIWFFCGLGMVYFPFALQRRFIFGLFLPVSILAVAGIQAFLGSRNQWVKKGLPIFWISSWFSNGCVILLVLFGIFSHQPLFFVTQDEAEGYRFIQENLPTDALILCSPETGLFIPAWTGRRVLYGHEFETVDAKIQKELAGSLLTGQMGIPRDVELMKQNSIGYVFSGPREQKIGHPDFQSAMKTVFQNASVTIFSW